MSLIACIGVGHAQPLGRTLPVGLVLETYRTALEHKDLDRLAALYLSFSPRQRDALREYLQNAAGLTVELADVTIAPLGDSVAVSYTRRDRFVDRASGRAQRLEVRLTKIFVWDNGQWKMMVGHDAR